MRHRKPMGWPAYMVGKRLSLGRTGYYWRPPTWASNKGCILRAEALGTDYADAKRRCDEILNQQFQKWLRGNELSIVPCGVVGTFSWMVAQYKASPRWQRLAAGTRTDYDRALRIGSQPQIEGWSQFR